ncbi:MAG: hypothetical protein DI570_15220 [Phenylobacterium zucineum]|nr:MAG: hypothetical protein DI570_15220 [Phenylobacterium zucineum]
MPKYHLNLFNGGGPVPDEAGQVLQDIDAARAQAIEGIRSILSAEIILGVVDLRGRIEIADETGDVLMTVDFTDAVQLQLPGGWR